MLLILFAAPNVFERYKIRNKCEAFHQGHHDDKKPFCTHSDVTDLVMTSNYENTEICSQVAFAPDPEDVSLPVKFRCPTFDEPTQESVNNAVIQGSRCVGDACAKLLADALKVQS
jgi:hypothetical protein